MYKEIDSFITSKFSPYLCGFRKNPNAWYSSLQIIENCKKQSDNDEQVRAFFLNLSKAFGTIGHILLFAKLEVYGFSKEALSLLQSYLCSKFDRSIINGFLVAVMRWSQKYLNDPFQIYSMFTTTLFIPKWYFSAYLAMSTIYLCQWQHSL